MAEPVALIALALDAALGWPQWLYRRIGHPVGFFARIISACAKYWNAPGRSDSVLRAWSILTVVVLVAIAGGLGFLLQILLLEYRFGWLAVAILAWPALAQRSLYDHVRSVEQALSAGDLEAGRTAVSAIVGRDTIELDQAGVTRAAIESLAESFCDGVVAPLFWLLLLGLPGVWTYKAINTADSMIGHREGPWRLFGWAAARTDDALNLIPARLSGVLLCLAGRRGWGTMWRDCRQHASPNAGWPEAAMAGALHVRLAGPVRYDGALYDKPWIGHEHREAEPADLKKALRVFLRACLLLWIIAGGFAWLR